MNRPDRRKGLLGRLWPGQWGDRRRIRPAHGALKDIQGFILRGYRMPMVRHFLLTVGVPAEARKLLGQARQRRRNRRAANHHRRGLACRVRAGPGRRSGRSAATQARLLPQRRHHLARIGRAGTEGSLPTLAFKSFGAFVAGAAERAELVGDVGPERAAKLDRRIRNGQ